MGKVKNDLTEGDLGKNILLFAMPLAATGILQQLFNAADIAVLGRYVGSDAMAAVGSNTPLTALIINLFVPIAFWFEEDGEYEAGWYDESEAPLKNDESVLGNANEIYFESGEGIWVNVRSGYAGCTINFPAISID